MTARAAYDKWTRSLAATHRYGYRNNVYACVYPKRVPVAYDFLSSDERATWRTFATAITPKHHN